MKLDEWMRKNSLSQTGFAKEIGCYPAQIHNILKGKYKPRPKLAKKIREYTNNEVTIDDLFNIPSMDEQKKRKKMVEEQIEFNLKQTCNPISLPENFLDEIADRIFKLIEG